MAKKCKKFVYVGPFSSWKEFLPNKYKKNILKAEHNEKVMTIVMVTVIVISAIIAFVVLIDSLLF